MTGDRTAFEDVVTSLLSDNSLRGHLERHAGVALERIAYGGGATNWYSLPSPESMSALVRALTPGSILSIYFDDRLAWHQLDEATKAEFKSVINRDGDAVLARRTADPILLDAEIVSGALEVDDHAEALGSEVVLLGAFPWPAKEGENAFTITLPDLDGVVRSHPH
jgi:hypothetical protein